MMKDLKALKEDEIKRTIENDLHHFAMKLAENGKKSYCAEAGLQYVMTAPSCWPNYIFSSDFDEGDAQSEINRVIQGIGRGELPDEWILGSFCRPESLAELLMNSGFRQKYSMTGMALDFEDLRDVASPGEIRVRQIENHEQLGRWVEIVSAGLFGRRPLGRELFEDFWSQGEAALFMAYYDHVPAAACLVTLSNGVAGLYKVAALPEFRQRGLGTAVVLESLKYARGQGYKMSVLHASGKGKPVYLKLGYREYCTMTAFEWKADSMNLVP